MRTITPKILHFGTPVAFISSLDADGSTNLAPISSFWALGWTKTFGLFDATKTAENLRRSLHDAQRGAECVVNLPGRISGRPDQWEMVEQLASLTGKDPVPDLEAAQFHTEKRKFEAAGFSRCASERVTPERAAECPFQMEARMLAPTRWEAPGWPSFAAGSARRSGRSVDVRSRSSGNIAGSRHEV